MTEKAKKNPPWQKPAYGPVAVELFISVLIGG